MPLPPVVADETVMLGAALVAVYPAGPLQLYETGEPVPVTLPALRVNEPPAHNVLDEAVTPLKIGKAFTETTPVVAQPIGEVYTTVS